MENITTLLSPSKKRRRSLEKNYQSHFIPTLLADKTTNLVDKVTFLNAYKTYQAIYFPQLLLSKKSMIDGATNKSKLYTSNSTSSSNIHNFTWKDISSIFHSLDEKDKESWTVENYKDSTAKNTHEDESKISKSHYEQSSLGYFLSNDEGYNQKGYCSFIIQHDKPVLSNLFEKLPLVDLPIADHDVNNKTNEDEDEHKCNNTEIKEIERICMNMTYGPCLWFFYGKNNSEKSIQGRPEHTDSVSHDGTWHYQLSGSKIWHLRPTQELCKSMKESQSLSGDELAFWEKQASLSQTENEKSSTDITITCQEGDVLLVNTRLWWHSTEIPNQLNQVPSVSYARDVYFMTSQNEDDAGHDTLVDNMTNLDGLYAANNIEMDTILFTENDMPDCELHRSRTNPNCKIIELEDGSMAVISCRDIQAGEFFCVMESDSESFDEDEDAGEDDYESEDM